jgi:hypothetical protein
MSHIKTFLNQVIQIAEKIDHTERTSLAGYLIKVGKNVGHLFILGVGGVTILVFPVDVGTI